MRFVVSALALLLAPGCVPYLVPPVRASLAGGATSEPPEVEGGDRKRDTHLLYQARAAFHPMSMSEQYFDSWVDAGVGYGMEHVPDRGGPMHGPYGELTGFFYRNRWSDSLTRAGGFGTLGLQLLPDSDEVGTAADLGFLLEYLTFVHGSGGGDGAAGFAHGSFGVGIFAGPGYRNQPDRSYWQFQGGVTLRVPLVIGAVCCVIPK